MSVNTASYLYSFSASIYYLPPKWAFGKIGCAEHEDGIRLDQFNMIWSLEVIFSLVYGVPHNFFIYGPIAPKLHQKVCIVTSLGQDKLLHVGNNQSVNEKVMRYTVEKNGNER